jgi:hypothetical protein
MQLAGLYPMNLLLLLLLLLLCMPAALCGSGGSGT